MYEIKNTLSMKDQEFGLRAIFSDHEIKTAAHCHDFIEITLVDRGLAMHRVEGEKASLLLPGDILFVLPGTRHEYWKCTNNTVLNCMFYPGVLGEDLGALKCLPLLDKLFSEKPDMKWGVTHLKSETICEITGILKKINCETTACLQGWKIRSKALLTEFLVSLSRVWKEQTNIINNDEKRDFVNLPYGMINQLEISENGQVNVENMAAAIGYSPEHFSRTFKKLTGIPPSSYLKGMRIALAAEKLMDDSIPIAKVAEMAGFTDVSYFSRIFKKGTGKTPSEFRKQKR